MEDIKIMNKKKLILGIIFYEIWDNIDNINNDSKRII